MDKVITVAIMAAIIHAGEMEEDTLDRGWSATEAIRLYEEVVKQIEDLKRRT